MLYLSCFIECTHSFMYELQYILLHFVILPLFFLQICGTIFTLILMGDSTVSDLEHYFQKQNLDTADIISIYRSGRKTVICCESGRELDSTIPMHEMLAFLPKEDFISISRSVIVRRDKILSISNEGIYTMIDGKTFQGRTRYLSAHRRLRRELNLSIPVRKDDFVGSSTVAPSF